MSSHEKQLIPRVFVSSGVGAAVVSQNHKIQNFVVSACMRADLKGQEQVPGVNLYRKMPCHGQVLVMATGLRHLDHLARLNFAQLYPRFISLMVLVCGDKTLLGDGAVRVDKETFMGKASSLPLLVPQ